MVFGFYATLGSLWNKDDPPLCYECGEVAEYDTAWLGVYVCGKQECMVSVIEGNCDPIEYEECDIHYDCEECDELDEGKCPYEDEKQWLED